MIEESLETVKLQLEDKKEKMWAADRAGDNGLRITYWAEVCKLLDKKHALEETIRVSCKEYAL